MAEEVSFPDVPISTWEKPDSKGLGRFCLALHKEGVVVLQVFGKGTVEGTHNITYAFDELFKTVGSGTAVWVIVDMRMMEGAPFRAQMVLGKWLLKRRERILGAAVVGGKPFDLKVTRTVVKMARLTEKVVFVGNENEAMTWVTRKRDQVPSSR